MRRILPILVFLLLTIAVASSAERRPNAASAQPEKIKLAVLVVFDQMRGDYLTRWNDLFGDGGFHRMEHDGAWFQNCYYPYADTQTGPGHASILTGCSPNRHGIIANNWFDRAEGRNVYCVGSENADIIGAKSIGEGRKEPGVSPERRRVRTVGDVLKEATKGKAKVVSLSLKDRAAVLPAATHPDACYWFDRGNFVTSSWYGERLHPWVEALNRSKPADGFVSRSWTKLLPDLDYVERSSAADSPGEGMGARLGKIYQSQAFPHPYGDEESDAYYEAVVNSPAGNEVLLALAKKAIDAEQLGKHEVPDLLCVSFSSNDYIGHAWGPDSQEVLDITLRSDRIVAELLEFLDRQVGRDKYIIAITADHGVCPLPEFSRQKGVKADRINALTMRLGAEGQMRKALGEGRWIEAWSEPWVYLNLKLLSERHVAPSRAEEVLADWLRQQAGVYRVFTRSRLMDPAPLDKEIGERVRRSFDPERSGDVVVIPQPYYLIDRPFGTGTTHGTPHPYDTHVPLLVLGPGIQGGTRVDDVTPQATAAIFARALGIAPPKACEAEVPRSLCER